MPANGYSLIELLVVLVIMSLIGVVGYVSYKQFSSAQVNTTGISQIQSVLRLAQTNATSSSICPGGSGPGSWSVSFYQSYFTLNCFSGDPVSPTPAAPVTYNFSGAKISDILGSSCGNTSIPLSTSPLLTVNYNNLGALTFSSTGALPACLQSAYWTFTVDNLAGGTPSKKFSISKGGAVDIQSP